ncbi:hypothetical protein [Sulfobacillus harzensis]|uniref:Uncharacterized protein n=1 Tax=Sulfobacillus harzensis TaxID=2729629 RepID=A0A7Y0L720_9FIRM|nr:hypothetical protein [Sulfobacillus harzensis]NMP24503.1 hypothetical protein [Sulfobacillus harzensis]
MQRHTRLHHRVTHRRWQLRRRSRLMGVWHWWSLKPQDVDTHAPAHILGKKRKDQRRVEERRFRQQVRRALVHDEPIPRYRHDYAD